MSKKRSTSRRPNAASIPRRVLEGLREADDLIQHKRSSEVRDLLEELDRKFSGQPHVLTRLANAYLALNDQRGYLSACERLVRVDDSDPELRLALAGGYLTNGLLMLARRNFREFVRRAPDHPRAADARQTLAELEQALPELLADLGVEGEAAQQLAELHEEVQSALNQGKYARARQLAAELLRRLPNFAPALNNLAQAYAAEGNLAEAIAASRRVLAFAPDNIHALSNLTRCLCLSGRLTEAREYAARLIASNAPAMDPALKKMEALTYLGDDQNVLAVFEQTARDGEVEREHNPMYWHLAAVAALRLGREAEAKRHWERALKIQPGFTPARENLDDLRQPVEKRNAPWAFTINYWVSDATSKDLERSLIAVQRRDDEAVTSAARRFFHKHPELGAIAPLLLDRCGRDGREFVITLARLGESPEMLKALAEFALGQRGSDDLRLQAAEVATQFGAMPTGMARLWLKGQWRDLLLMGFELHGEPVRTHKHRPEVERWLSESVRAMHAGELEQAEQLLGQALAVEPDKSDLLHNLGGIYAVTGRESEAEAIWRRIFERDPDYLFARTSLARMAALRGEVEKAREFLDPLFTRRRLHFSEFSALAGAEIDLLVAEGKKDGARSWIGMWEEAVPDDPKLDHYRRRVGKPALKPRWEDFISRRR